MFAAEAEHIRVEFGEDGDSRVGLGHHERRELALFLPCCAGQPGVMLNFKVSKLRGPRTNPESCAGETTDVSDPRRELSLRRLCRTHLSRDQHVRFGENIILDDGRHDSVDVTTLLMHMLRRKVGRDEFGAEHALRVFFEVLRVRHEVEDHALVRPRVRLPEFACAAEKRDVSFDCIAEKVPLYQHVRRPSLEGLTLTSVDLVVLGILHTLVARADMNADAEHRRQRHNGSVLRDQVERRRFGLEEVVRDAREGSLLLQAELPDPLLQMFVLERSVDHASVREELFCRERR